MQAAGKKHAEVMYVQAATGAQQLPVEVVALRQAAERARGTGLRTFSRRRLDAALFHRFFAARGHFKPLASTPKSIHDDIREEPDQSEDVECVESQTTAVNAARFRGCRGVL